MEKKQQNNASKQIAKAPIPELQWLELATDFMDSKLRIPFTNIRFGLDAILGIIPVAGEIVSFSISGVMLLAMARHGVSGKVIVMMVGNIMLDAIVGAIPFVGTIFNIGYKANVRNMTLLQDHYEEGKHQGNGLKIVFFVLGILLLCLGLLIYGLWQFFAYLWDVFMLALS
ncbi:MAG: DUF4112 domain-containing protein [Chitinophagales bacterium]